VTPKAEKPRNPKRRRSAYRAIRYVRATPGRCGAVALEAAPPSLGRHLLQVSQAGCQPFTRRWRPEPAPCTTELPVDCLGQVAVMPAKARTERLRHSAPLARVSGNVAAAERRSTHAARASNSSTGEAVFRAALSGTAWTRRLRRHASRRATGHAVNPGLDASHSEARCQRGRVFPSATRHHASGHVPSVRLPLRRPDADSHLPGDHQGRRTRILGDAVYDPTWSLPAPQPIPVVVPRPSSQPATPVAPVVQSQPPKAPAGTLIKAAAETMSRMKARERYASARLGTRLRALCHRSVDFG
jgi:hypothetical protein